MSLSAPPEAYTKKDKIEQEASRGIVYKIVIVFSFVRPRAH